VSSAAIPIFTRSGTSQALETIALRTVLIPTVIGAVRYHGTCASVMVGAYEVTPSRTAQVRVQMTGGFYPIAADTSEKLHHGKQEMSDGTEKTTVQSRVQRGSGRAREPA
jgi:hypothetical protein